MRETTKMPFDIDNMPDDHSLVALVDLVDLDTIIDIVDPLSNPPWEDVDSPISIDEVRHAIENEVFTTTPLNEGLGLPPEERRFAHVSRIAYLVLHPSSDPIVLAIGASSDTCPAILDGHHRIAAALIRRAMGDDENRIPVTFDGYLGVALELFPKAEFFSTPIEDDAAATLSR